MILGIKHMNIYDPFNELKIDGFKNKIEKFYNKNFSILIRDENNLKLEKTNYDIIISIISFKNANEELIQNLNTSLLPPHLNYLDSGNLLSSNLKNYKYEYEKFLTRKKCDYLPELIFFFGEEEINLYGYPFTLLENAEILKAEKLSRFDVLKYIHLIENFSKIDKRFGK